jgi:hypothetical protein
MILIGQNINTAMRSTEVLLEASKGVCLEVNTEKTMYMFMSRQHNAGQIHHLIRALKM